MFMSSRRRKIIAIVFLPVEILAVILCIFGLYTHFSSAGNPVGSIYLLIGFFLSLGGGIVLFFVFRGSSRMGQVQTGEKAQPKETREEEQGPMER